MTRLAASTANRGMALEQLINVSNRIYTQKGLAVINKRPTPVKIVRTKGTKVMEAFLEAPSTVDYEGCYRGHSLQFEAKSTKQTTRFDLDNVHQHQVEHMRSCIEQGAICFIVLEFSQLHQIFYMPGKMVVDAWDGRPDGRKSIPYDDIARLCHLIPSTRGVPVDYLAVVDKLLVQRPA